MERTFYHNKEFFDIRVIGYDDKATVVTDGGFVTRDFFDVDPFIRTEMLCVFHCDKPCKVEIRDHTGMVVFPFRFKANSIILCPWFFGRGYGVYIGENKILDLTIEYWNTYRRPVFVSH